MSYDYDKILKDIYLDVKEYLGKGKVADYIPALSKVDPKKYGVAIVTLDGEEFCYGDAKYNFSIQSISKVFVLAIAFGEIGMSIWDRVGKEPSGNPFNSLVQLENENGKPRNPFINAGALVVTDIIISKFPDAYEEILSFVRNLSNNKNINYDKDVTISEKEAGFRNAALANFMKSFGNINNEVDDILDVYFHHCSLSMNCLDLARSFLFLANHGKNPFNDQQVLSVSQAKRINSIMLTCGLYDESGDFAFRVGMPGKSGVGGGIAAIIPGKLAMCVWSPELNKFGNSLAGIETLERFTTITGVSIF